MNTLNPLDAEATRRASEWTPFSRCSAPTQPDANHPPIEFGPEYARTAAVVPPRDNPPEASGIFCPAPTQPDANHPPIEFGLEYARTAAVVPPRDNPPEASGIFCPAPTQPDANHPPIEFGLEYARTSAVVPPRDNPPEASGIDPVMIAAAERGWNSDIKHNRIDNRHDSVWVIGIALIIAFGLGWAGGAYSDGLFTDGAEKTSDTKSLSPEPASAKSRINPTIAASEASKPAKSPAANTIAAERANIPPVDPPRLSTPTSDQISSLIQERASAPQPTKVRTPVLETRPNTIAGWTVREVRSGRATLEGPGGVWTAAIGDSVPGVGKVESIVLWGGYWVVATRRGLISTR